MLRNKPECKIDIEKDSGCFCRGEREKGTYYWLYLVCRFGKFGKQIVNYIFPQNKTKMSIIYTSCFFCF